MADAWYPLEPKFNIFQLTNPGKISGNISMPKPVIGAISSWLES
jgi:hypothetical protein